jgi:bifunctional DNA-binding transcriptional regulator/antitoxin component of YhaV-PrlF toxin-antitoxin module
MSASLTISAGCGAELVKTVRESLSLEDGDLIQVETRDGEVVVRRADRGRGLIEENGLLVYDSGVDIGDGDIVRWIKDDRERRMKYVSGEVAEPRISSTLLS